MKLLHAFLANSVFFFSLDFKHLQQKSSNAILIPRYKSPTKIKTLIEVGKQYRQNEIMLPQADFVLITLWQTSLCCSSRGARPSTTFIEWLRKHIPSDPLDASNALHLSLTIILSKWMRL